MIVFDASTLILIAKAELLDLFLETAKEPVSIPRKVESECCGVTKTLDALTIQRAIDESRVKIREVKSRRVVAKLQDDFSLGQGEAEAIALAVAEKASLLGVDDKNGINACKLLNVPFTTAIGILVRSKENRLLESSDALAKLALLARYGRYKESIIENARSRLETNP